MPSHEVETVDPASLDRFRADLVAAGFRGSDAGRRWVGPIDSSLTAFTDRAEMTIVVRDGWPYVDPELLVDGMRPLEHVNERGVVCLWQRGDSSQQWRTLAGWRERIAAWSAAQADGFDDRDATTDAHRYFERYRETLATLDLGALAGDARDGARGNLYGRWRPDGSLELGPDRAGSPVKGRWFFREAIEAPPRRLSELHELLTSDQRESFDGVRATAARSGDRVVAFVWRTGSELNAMIVLLEAPAKRNRNRRDARARPVALELAPTDRRFLLARAGDDAAWLASRELIVFGAGGIGSHAAVILAASGVGTMTLVDAERLRPGNVVRHAAGAQHVGRHKVHAVANVIAEHAPWTSVEPLVEEPWAPGRLRELVERHDLVLDATGNTGFGEQLSVLLHDASETLVTAALYRRGAIARVARQASGDTPIVARGGDPARYPVIPRAPGGDPVDTEPGCTATVNNAPPVTVVGCARLAASVTIDALSDAPALPDEVTEVLHPLPDPPFDRVGIVGAG